MSSHDDQQDDGGGGGGRTPPPPLRFLEPSELPAAGRPMYRAQMQEARSPKPHKCPMNVAHEHEEWDFLKGGVSTDPSAPGVWTLEQGTDFTRVWKSAHHSCLQPLSVGLTNDVASSPHCRCSTVLARCPRSRTLFAQFHRGFQRRPQWEIRQDASRMEWEQRKVLLLCTLPFHVAHC